MENFQNRAKTRSRLAKGKQRKDGKRLRNRPRNSQKPKEAAFQTTPTRSIFGGQLRSELSRDFSDPQMAEWPGQGRRLGRSNGNQHPEHSTHSMLSR